MTNEDLKRRLAVLQEHEQNEIDRIRHQSKIEQQNALNEWAKEHAQFNVGDIINSFSITIRVEKIVGRISLGHMAYVQYNGHALTKQLKERADGWIASIYEDGRKIVKIK